MPQALIIPLITLAAGVGEFAYGIATKPGDPKPVTPTPAGADPNAQAGEKQSFFQAAPSVQERLGGSVSPDFFASEVARVSGNPGDTELAKQTLSQLLGLGSSPDSQGTAAQGGGSVSGSPNTFGQLNPPASASGGGSAMPSWAGGGQGAPPGFFESLLQGSGQQQDPNVGMSGGYA